MMELPLPEELFTQFLSQQIAREPDPDAIDEKRMADLEAAAWAESGNAKRIAFDFLGITDTFRKAWGCLANGTGDPRQEARLMSLEALCMEDMGRLELAESSLAGALQLYRNLNVPHEQGCTLLRMAEVIGPLRPERGIAYLREALPLLDPKEPSLVLRAEQALAELLNDVGRWEEALSLLERAFPLDRQHQDEWAQLRWRWLKGKIVFRAGRLAEAESLLLQIWSEIQTRRLTKELLLFAIDLAQVFAQKGEWARAAQLAAELDPSGLQRHGRAAWLLFRDGLSLGQIRDDFFRGSGSITGETGSWTCGLIRAGRKNRSPWRLVTSVHSTSPGRAGRRAGSPRE
jgi:tetratricopeptide (TPR) repeat protein